MEAAGRVNGDEGDWLVFRSARCLPHRSGLPMPRRRTSQQGSGLPMPHRRTFASGILPDAHCMSARFAILATLAPIARLTGHWQPLAAPRSTASSSTGWQPVCLPVAQVSNLCLSTSPRLGLPTPRHRTLASDILPSVFARTAHAATSLMQRESARHPQGAATPSRWLVLQGLIRPAHRDA